MEPEKKEEKLHHVRVLWDFLLHVFVGLIFFAIIAAPALGLDKWMQGLENGEVSGFVLFGLRLAEYFLFTVDLLLFGAYIVKAAWRSAKKF